MFIQGEAICRAIKKVIATVVAFAFFVSFVGGEGARALQAPLGTAPITDLAQPLETGFWFSYSLAKAGRVISALEEDGIRNISVEDIMDRRVFDRESVSDLKFYAGDAEVLIEVDQGLVIRYFDPSRATETPQGLVSAAQLGLDCELNVEVSRQVLFSKRMNTRIVADKVDINKAGAVLRENLFSEKAPGVTERRHTGISIAEAKRKSLWQIGIESLGNWGVKFIMLGVLSLCGLGMTGCMSDSSSGSTTGDPGTELPDGQFPQIETGWLSNPRAEELDPYIKITLTGSELKLEVDSFSYRRPNTYALDLNTGRLTEKLFGASYDENNPAPEYMPGTDGYKSKLSTGILKPLYLASFWEIGEQAQIVEAFDEADRWGSVIQEGETIAETGEPEGSIHYKYTLEGRALTFEAYPMRTPGTTLTMDLDSGEMIYEYLAHPEGAFELEPGDNNYLMHLNRLQGWMREITNWHEYNYPEDQNVMEKVLPEVNKWEYLEVETDFLTNPVEEEKDPAIKIKMSYGELVLTVDRFSYDKPDFYLLDLETGSVTEFEFGVSYDEHNPPIEYLPGEEGYAEILSRGILKPLYLASFWNVEEKDTIREVFDKADQWGSVLQDGGSIAEPGETYGCLHYKYTVEGREATIEAYPMRTPGTISTINMDTGEITEVFLGYPDGEFTWAPGDAGYQMHLDRFRAWSEEITGWEDEHHQEDQNVIKKVQAEIFEFGYPQVETEWLSNPIVEELDPFIKISIEGSVLSLEVDSFPYRRPNTYVLDLETGTLTEILFGIPYDENNPPTEYLWGETGHAEILSRGVLKPLYLASFWGIPEKDLIAELKDESDRWGNVIHEGDTMIAPGEPSGSQHYRYSVDGNLFSLRAEPLTIPETVMTFDLETGAITEVFAGDQETAVALVPGESGYQNKLDLLRGWVGEITGWRDYPYIEDQSVMRKVLAKIAEFGYPQIETGWLSNPSPLDVEPSIRITLEVSRLTLEVDRFPYDQPDTYILDLESGMLREILFGIPYDENNPPAEYAPGDSSYEERLSTGILKPLYLASFWEIGETPEVVETYNVVDKLGDVIQDGDHIAAPDEEDRDLRYKYTINGREVAVEAYPSMEAGTIVSLNRDTGALTVQELGNDAGAVELVPGDETYDAMFYELKGWLEEITSWPVYHHIEDQSIMERVLEDMILLDVPEATAKAEIPVPNVRDGDHPAQPQVMMASVLPEGKLSINMILAVLATLAAAAMISSERGGERLSAGMAEYIEANADLFSRLLGEGGRPVMIRVPISMLKGQQNEHMLTWIKALNEVPNIHVMLYASGSPDKEAEISEYAELGLERKEFSVQPDRKNTVTIFAANKGITKDEIHFKFTMNPGMKNSIVVPVGIKDDATGLIRATILGLRLMQIARNPEDNEFVRATIRGYSDLIGFPHLLMTASEIKALALGKSINTVVNVLKVLIDTLPIRPMDAEEIRALNERARKVLIAA